MIDTTQLWFAPFFSDNTPENFLRELSVVANKIAMESPERTQPARLEDGAKIIGTVVFGENCIVGHGALIVGPAIFGDGCVVGHASEVARSVFGNSSRAAHFNYVGDSVLGSGVNLGAGAKLANLRFDKQPINGFEKLGAVLGDGVQIGCNAVIDPGVKIDSNVWFAGAHLPHSATSYTRETIKRYFYDR